MSEQEPTSIENALERGPEVLRIGIISFHSVEEFFTVVEHQDRKERIKMLGDLAPLATAIGANFDHIPYQQHTQLAHAFLNGVALGARVAKLFLTTREQDLIGELDMFARMNSFRALTITQEFVDEARIYGHYGYEHAKSYQGLVTELSRKLYRDGESEQALKEGFGFVFHGMVQAQAMAARFDATESQYNDESFSQMRDEATRIKEVGWDDDAELRKLLSEDR